MLQTLLENCCVGWLG